MRPPYPVMAAWLAAASAACALPGSAFAETSGPPPTTPVTLSAKDVDALSTVLAPQLKDNSAAQDDAVKAIKALVLDPVKQYAVDDMRKAENDAKVGPLIAE